MSEPVIRESPHQAIQRRAIERARSAGFTWPPDYEVSDIGQCRSCGATILWTITPRGARSPLDKEGTSHFISCPTAAQHRRPR